MQTHTSPSKQRQEPHFACLDLCDFRWTSESAHAAGSENAVLWEIWHTGGLFQIDRALPRDSTVVIGGAFFDLQIEGTVSSSQQDEYGFLVEVRVNSPKNWFPGAYQPPYLLRHRPASHSPRRQKILRAG
jgi:hypothetical protein